jgi:Putative zinc-finger
VNGSNQRDQAVERLLRQSLKAPPAGVTESCLDAETLSAWIDGGLSGAALEVAQSHVADCARCQALVGAMARTDTIVRQPESVSRLWLAWLVPLTAAAAAVVLWIAVPRVVDAPSPQATNTQNPAFQAKAPEPTLESQAQATASATSPAKEEQASRAKKDLASPDQAQTAELRKDAGRLETDRLQQQPKAAGEITSSPSADQAASGLAASPPPAAPAERQAFGARSANALAERSTVGIEIISPDPASRWRLVGSVVEHSMNGGASWQAVPAGVATPLTAGAAPSPSVCWLVGRGGVVLLSTDGRSVSRVAFPEITDLSSVRATDARSATVSTTDGRTYVTTDGGATWERR